VQRSGVAGGGQRDPDLPLRVPQRDGGGVVAEHGVEHLQDSPGALGDGHRLVHDPGDSRGRLRRRTVFGHVPASPSGRARAAIVMPRRF
jgi:hypothetical protein